MVLMVLSVLFSGTQMWGQEEGQKTDKKSISLMRKAEKAKKNQDFVGAEADYRRSISKDKNNAEASYNFGHLYSDHQMDTESLTQLFKTVKNAQTKELRHKAFHNLGNAFMDREDYAQAVRAYKDALRNDPTDDETRYNLALAKEKLEQNPDQDDENDQDQEQDDQNEDDENTRDNKEHKDNQDEDNDDDQEQDQDQNDQDGQSDQDQEQDDQNDGQDQDSDPQNDQDQNGEGEPQEQEGEPQLDEGEMSDEQAENLLRAADNLERGVQKKLNEKKGDKIPPQPNQKDW